MNQKNQIILEKFVNVGFPIRFTDSVITQFEDKQNDENLIIPKFLFKEPKKLQALTWNDLFEI